MKIDRIDYRQIPGQNLLFLNYLHDFAEIEEFYSDFPIRFELFDERLKTIRESERLPREYLISSLETLNRSIGAGEVVLKNIEVLKSPQTVIVATGQQVGLFGGPSYSIYKAVTAVRLAAHFNEMGCPAIPMFWLAADDSDFEEVRSTWSYAQDGSAFAVRYPNTRVHRQQMAGTVPLSAATRCLEDFESQARRGGFSSELISLLRESYLPERSYREGFAAWLSALFKDYGLVIFDPLEKSYRTHLSDFYKTAVTLREELVDSVRLRNEALQERGFPVQVFLDPAETFLFWFDGDNRYKLEFQNGVFQAKERRSVRFSRSEILEAIEREPQRFGPNVLLRPILQDYLFPTLLTVVGPSEIAYFAQVNALSRFWDLEMAVYPRSGFTVVDRKTQRLLGKYELDVETVLKSSLQGLTKKILRTLSVSNILDEFDEIETSLDASLQRLKGMLGDQDPGVADMLGNSEKKMLYQLGKVRNRFVANQRTRDTHLNHHISHLRNHLLPQGYLQERVINFNSFLMEEGYGFLDAVVEAVEPFSRDHRLLYL
jgi:bacillithiol biosynthesis cysteine-adding enzyme BshC